MPPGKIHLLHFRALFDADAGGEEGFLRARVCELDAVDRIGLVIASGGLKELRRDAVISGWSHNAVGMATAPPVGRGFVYEDGKFLMAEGHYNLEMQTGRDAYESVKMLKDKVEFSILMHVLEAESRQNDGEWHEVVTRYDVSEWSACQRGVSYNTGVEEMRAEPIAKVNHRPIELERRFDAMRLRALEHRSSAT